VEVLEASKDQWVTCDRCKQKTQVKVPDGNARVQAASKLFELGYGRTKEQTEAEARSERAAEVQRELQDMTDDELLAEIVRLEG
jgi:transcription elongation factor Elf1